MQGAEPRGAARALHRQRARSQMPVQQEAPHGMVRAPRVTERAGGVAVPGAWSASECLQACKLRRDDHVERGAEDEAFAARAPEANSVFTPSIHSSKMVLN